MSFNRNIINDDDDENESFHSFAQSEADSFDLDDLSNFDESDNLSVENQQCDNNIPSICAVAQASFLADISSSASSIDESESNIKPNLRAVESAKEPKPSPGKMQTTSRKYCMDQYMVPEPSGSCFKPDMSLFEMSISNKKDALNVSANTEALQKFAYTEIWIERQQADKQSGSLRRKLSAALEGLFPKESSGQLEEQQPKETIRKPTSNPLSSYFQNIPEDQPYVSPFEDFPLQPAEKKLPGQKPFITVPAGYDLTQLVEYKNPNHWHRRATTRYDTQP